MSLITASPNFLIVVKLSGTTDPSIETIAAISGDVEFVIMVVIWLLEKNKLAKEERSKYSKEHRTKFHKA